VTAARLARCKSCGAPIRWAITDRALPLALDYEPSPEGTVRLATARVYGGTPRAFIVPQERRARLAGELHTAHRCER
jgi:hypothetical protein